MHALVLSVFLTGVLLQGLAASAAEHAAQTASPRLLPPSLRHTYTPDILFVRAHAELEHVLTSHSNKRCPFPLMLFVTEVQSNFSVVTLYLLHEGSNQRINA